MNITYQLISASGNPTAIINGQYPSLERDIINQKIFSTNKLVEQIGYVFQKNNQYYFEMMGNEFSGNGCRAATFFLLKNTPAQINFFASGINKPIIGQLINNYVTVSMPSPKIIFNQIDNSTYSTIFIGTLMIISSNTIKNIPKLIKQYSSQYSAIGFMEYQTINNNINLIPRFWVKNTNTLVNETACGSGSIVLAKLLQLKIAQIWQPSGFPLVIKFKNQSISLGGQAQLLGTYNVKI